MLTKLLIGGAALGTIAAIAMASGDEPRPSDDDDSPSKKDTPPTPSVSEGDAIAQAIAQGGGVGDMTNAAYWLAYPDCPERLDPSEASHAECIVAWKRIKAEIQVRRGTTPPPPDPGPSGLPSNLYWFGADTQHLVEQGWTASSEYREAVEETARSFEAAVELAQDGSILPVRLVVVSYMRGSDAPSALGPMEAAAEANPTVQFFAYQYLGVDPSLPGATMSRVRLLEETLDILGGGDRPISVAAVFNQFVNKDYLPISTLPKVLSNAVEWIEGAG